MINNWKSLVLLKDEMSLCRGAWLRFPATYPFEAEIIWMICENRLDINFPINFITISGDKAAINPVQCLPRECLHSEGGLSISWLKLNWKKWVYSECNVDDVLVKLNPLNVEKII